MTTARGSGRVLLVSPSAKPGGAERSFVSLARCLPSRGIAVDAAVLEDGPLGDWLREAGCPVTVLEAGRLRQPVGVRRTIAALRTLARARRSAAVVSLMDKGHVYGGAAAFAAGLPAVWWQPVIPKKSRFELVAARVPSAAVVCVCDAAVATQRRLTPRKRVVKIESGTAVGELLNRRGSGQLVRAQLGWRDSPLVGIVGRLQPSKGQHVFLDAIARVRRDHPNARYLVVGGAILGWEGSYPDELRQLTERLGLNERVHFAGHRDDPVPWIDALDISVLASSGEGFPLALLEAMVLGKAVVATACGGPEELVRDRIDGLLVPPGDSAQMACAISALLADDEFALTLGRRAERRASEFSDERMAERFARLLDDVVHGARRTARRDLGVEAAR